MTVFGSLLSLQMLSIYMYWPTPAPKTRMQVLDLGPQAEDAMDGDAMDDDATDEDATDEGVQWMRMQWMRMQRMVWSGLVWHDPLTDGSCHTRQDRRTDGL